MIVQTRAREHGPPQTEPSSALWITRLPVNETTSAAGICNDLNRAGAELRQ
jgi:hypothetical protein